MTGVTEKQRCGTCGHLHPRKGKGGQVLRGDVPDSLVMALAHWALGETLRDLPDMRRAVLLTYAEEGVTVKEPGDGIRQPTVPQARTCSEDIRLRDGFL